MEDRAFAESHFIQILTVRPCVDVFNGDLHCDIPIIAQLETEEEFEELLEIAADYYRRLDQDDVEMAIERLMKKRSLKTIPFDPLDPDLKVFGSRKMCSGILFDFLCLSC